MKPSLRFFAYRMQRILTSLLLFLLSVSLSLSSWLPSLAATRIDIVGSSRSGNFGEGITVLPNGNIVIVDTGYDGLGDISDVGAVYLYNGATAQLISTLVGSHENDRIGSGGVIVLKNGNFVISSLDWDSDSAPNVGAVTWGNATTGVSGIVSSSNSLVGTVTGDRVGSGGIMTLRNGNYLVRSPNCDIGAANSAGAVTWGDGNSGVSGVVSSSNSLVGNASGVHVGEGGVIELRNGNYVVQTPKWVDNFVPNRGAVTWGNGSTGIRGVVNSSNSLVGSTKDDSIGRLVIVPLDNGNYLVVSPDWDNGNAVDAGAVTWGDGSTGIRGAVGSSNSLVGTITDDKIGYTGITILSNGNYVVKSLFWDNGTAVDAGAATWGNGSTGISGPVSNFNSLVGSSSGDRVSASGVTALKNGNYVVASPSWSNGGTKAVGAVTAGSGASGIKGEINSGNSLIGSQENDLVGSSGALALSNGNYVVVSPQWDNADVVDAGAVTWGNGSTGTSGVVNNSNSLVGSRSQDNIGDNDGLGVVELSNSNYVVVSPKWDNGITIDAGAATWGSGTSGVSGIVSGGNSLIGTHSNDRVGGELTPLVNGNYVVRSFYWDNDSVVDAGAATWGNGSTGTFGVVSSSNSLVGNHTEDYVGNHVSALQNGNYVVDSSGWDNGSVTNAGAATWGNGSTGSFGVVSSSNSLVGSSQDDKVGYGIWPLKNGNYVVLSPEWNNGTAKKAGAATWANGSTGISGVVSSNNSLVGSTQDDRVGSLFTELSNGNFLLRNGLWDNSSAVNAGALTWVNGVTGITGAVDSNNSLLGTSSNDQVGSGNYIALPDGNYMTRTSFWDSPTTPNVGAVTWVNGSAGISGLINSNNSVLGAVDQGSSSIIRDEFDPVNQQMVVGLPLENTVALFRLTPAEIAVTGKGIAVGDGDNSPVSNDGTDLGAKVVGSGAAAQGFTISNTGDGALTINSISLSGANASDFGISNFSAPKTLAPNSVVTFSLNFTPSAVGLRTATVNIASSDGNENPYNFAVQGTGTQHTLTTNKAGDGTGSLILSPASGSYNHNTVVIVTAKADAGSTFAGWNGDCSGSGSCSVTMTSAKSVTATFNKGSGSTTKKVYLPIVVK